MSDPTRRLRVVPPLPGQLTLDLPGLPPPMQPAPAAPRRVCAVPPAEPGAGGGVGSVPRLAPTRHTDPDGPAVPARIPAAVWAVWDDEDLVGVYAEESTARSDAAVIRRDATRAGHPARTVDCLPLQVFTEPQHTRQFPRWTPSHGGPRG